MAVASPCISVCKLDEATGYCIGCKRTSQEIAMWLYYSDEEKTDVLEALPRREIS
jgi:predicted Fe-S protein YdhL (DUF1289 family)